MNQLPIITYQDEDGIFIAECPLIQGFHTHGKNIQELYNNIEEVKELFKEEIQTLQNKKNYNYLSVSLLPVTLAI
jgi:predicted RNase H-like HicB family nuclease